MSDFEVRRRVLGKDSQSVYMVVDFLYVLCIPNRLPLQTVLAGMEVRQKKVRGAQTNV